MYQIYQTPEAIMAVVLVTGAAGGIGAAIADEFLASGNQVLGVDLVFVEHPDRSGFRALSADLADPRTPANMVDAAVAEFGRLDVLVNCAAVLPVGTVDTATLKVWDDVLAINIRAVGLACAAAIQQFRRQAAPAGTIINVASTAGLNGGARIPVYSATKGAVIALSRALALDHAADGIRVNAVLPGSIRTRMTDTYLGSVADPDGAYADLLERLPLHRQGQPEEVARAVSFLASEAASYITGSALVVDGAFSIS